MTKRVHRFLRPQTARAVVQGAAFCVAAVVVASSAVIAKRAAVGPALVALDTRIAENAPPKPASPPVESVAASPERAVEASEEVRVEIERVEEIAPEDSTIRWFDGRPVRPVKTIWMVVTAYSPDHRSCGKWADGRTATNTSVWTNGMQLVAADTRILPYGSLLTVPGYANEEIVPVLDCGGAIKGARLDVLYPTHERARQWGVQRLPVTVWEYADAGSSNE